MVKFWKVLWILYSASLDYFFSGKRMMGILSKYVLLFLTRRQHPPPLGLASWWSSINKDENWWLIVWAHPRFILFKTQNLRKRKRWLHSKEGPPNPSLHILQLAGVGGRGPELCFAVAPTVRTRERQTFQDIFLHLGTLSTVAEEGNGEAVLLDPQFKDSSVV